MSQTLFSNETGDDSGDTIPTAAPALDANATPTKKTAKTKPTVGKYRRMFDDSREAMSVGRTLSALARDYYDGNQITEYLRQILKDRGQPDVAINRVRRAVDGILGIIEQGKTDPRALMRNPAKPQGSQGAQPSLLPQTPPTRSLMMGGAPLPGAGGAPMGMPPQAQQPQQLPPQLQMGANGGPPMGGNVVPFPNMGGGPPPPQAPDLDAGDVATMTLRYIADKARFQPTKMDMLEHMCIEGCAGAIVGITDKKEIPITFIPFEEYFYDPRSRKADFSDKRYDGIAKWMYADDIAALYPDKADEIEKTVTAGDAGLGADPTWEDKPDRTTRPWIDRKSRRLMMVEMYVREDGQWLKVCFHGSGFLEEPTPSPYVDEENKPMNPIEAASGYVARNLLRYGVVKDMIDIQNEINQRRAKALHEINTRQIQQTDPNAPPCDETEARKEAARPDGILPTGYQVVPRSDVVANNIEMLQEAKAEIERLAPNPAILGRQGAEESGRAQQFRAQAGMTELSRFLGRFTDWENRVYKQAWARARQFWDAPQWIRVTDDIGAPQYVMVNDYDHARQDPQTGQWQVPNRIAEMDVDIVLDATKDTATLDQEIFNELMEIAKAYVGTPQMVPFKVLLEMSPLPKRQEVIKRLEAAQAEAAQAAAPGLQLDAQDKQADVAKKQSESVRNQAQANKYESDIGRNQGETVKNIATAKHVDIEATRSAMEGFAHARSPERGLLPPLPAPQDSGAPSSGP